MDQDFEVSVTAVINCASALSQLGNQVSEKLHLAFLNIEDLGLSKSWIGNQYDNVVDSINKYVDELNQLIIDASVTIPTNLELAAKNYAIADGIPICNANINRPTLLEPILKSNHPEGQIIYKEDYIDSARTVFSQNFIAVDGTLNYYSHVFSGIIQNEWVGKAMEQYLSAVNKFSKNATAISNDINNVIKENINNAQISLNTAEDTIKGFITNIN